MMLNATTGGDSRAWEPGCVLNKKWVKEKPSFSKTNQSSSEAWKEFRISNAINTPCHKMIKMQACGYLTLAVCRKVYFFEGLQKPGKSFGLGPKKRLATSVSVFPSMPPCNVVSVLQDGTKVDLPLTTPTSRMRFPMVFIHTSVIFTPFNWEFSNCAPSNMLALFNKKTL